MQPSLEAEETQCKDGNQQVGHDPQHKTSILLRHRHARSGIGGRPIDAEAVLMAQTVASL